jgi:acyl-coenzyme A synthetase/AMP-(fatty) acid ligase
VALESVLVTHPEVLECGVVAVQDEQWGERPKAFITIKSGSSLSHDKMIQWCRDHRGISRFMVPREVEVVQELPKTSTGKIRKNVLRTWVGDGKREA